MGIAKKLGQLVATVLLVTLFSAFLLTLLPGDLADIIVPFGTDEQREQVREDLRLDAPFISQYGRWLSNFAQGDLGDFYSGPTSRRPVSETVKEALPKSIELMVWAQIIALVIAIPLGVVTAYKNGSVLDRFSGLAGFAMLAFPAFALGFVLQYFFGVKLGWLPTGGFVPASVSMVDHVKSMILPAMTLAVAQIAIYMRLLRSDMIQTLQQDFILMAKAKGLSSKTVLFRHALRPSSLTLLTVAGLNIGTLIGGALVVEVVYNIPGMGLQMAKAIGGRQPIAFQSMVAVIAIFYVLVNFAVDLLYTVLDPRIRNASN